MKTAAFVLLLAWPAGAAAAEPLLTPRMQSLATAVEERGAAAVSELWREVESSGTPLIEPIEGEPDQYWVTFLWRYQEGDGPVLVLGLGSGSEFTSEVMDRLPGTDVLYRTYRRGRGFRGSYQLSPDDPLTLPDLDDPGWWPRRIANFRADPLNPRTFGPSYSLIELPGAPPQPWIEEQEGVARGRLEEHSSSSKTLENERTISVYLPPDYEEMGASYPLLLIFDRGAYLRQVPTPTVLDNLIAQKKIPPLVAVLIGNAPGARNSELPCNPDFARYLAEELIPFLRHTYHVTEDPSETVIGGSSFGALAASYFALEHPELVGNVLSQSGSYWWADGWDFRHPDPAIEGEWLTRQYVERERQQVRFYLDVGIHEPGNPSMAVVNRHFRDVLLAKGYEVARYVELNSGHDYAVWRGTLADGLIELLAAPDLANR